jgi:hypothetical protein
MIVDGQGRHVKSGRISSTSARIDLHASAPGMYILRLVTPEGGHSEHRILKR